MEFISCLANSSLHLGSWMAEWGSPWRHCWAVSEVSVYVPVTCVGPGDLKQLQALCFGVPAGVIFLL